METRQNYPLVNVQSNLPTNGAAASVRRAYSARLTMPEAIESVGKMIDGAYPNARKNVSNSYIGTLAALLLTYPKSIAMRCVDPINGVARTTKFLPTVADIVAWCERPKDTMEHIVDFDARSEQQFRERDEFDRREREESVIRRREVVDRIRREMAAAGMPLDGDRDHGETPAKVQAKLGLTDEQWAALPDAGTTWTKPIEDVGPQSEHLEVAE